MHKENMNETAGMVQNSKAFSVAFDYMLEEASNLNIYGEVISGNDLDYTKDLDQRIYHLGVALTPVDKVTVVAQYNNIVYKDNNQHVEPTLVKYSIGPKYKMDSGVTLILEYANETLDADTGADDITADVVALRAACKF